MINIQITDPQNYQFVAQMEVDGAEIPTAAGDGFDIIFKLELSVSLVSSSISKSLFLRSHR